MKGERPAKRETGRERDRQGDQQRGRGDQKGERPAGRASSRERGREGPGEDNKIPDPGVAANR